MKKFLTAILCISMLIFTGCETKEKASVPDLNKVFTADSTITSKDFEAKAKISRLGGGMWEIDFSEPDTLSGIKIAFNGEEISASYQGLSFSVPDDILPAKPVFTKLFKSIDKSVQGEEIPYTENEGIITYENEIEEIGKFVISIKKDTGSLIHIAFPKDNIHVEFENYECVN